MPYVGGFYYIRVTVTDIPCPEKNHSTIRVWLRIELHHLQVLEPKDRKAQIPATIPRGGCLGIW